MVGSNIYNKRELKFWPAFTSQNHRSLSNVYIFKGVAFQKIICVTFIIVGTVVAMEKEAGVLKPEYMSIIEATRDQVIASLSQHISN